MLKALTFLALTSLAAAPALAQNEAALPPSLKATMKAMSADLKTIAAHMNQPQFNESSALLADQFAQLVLHAKTFTPDSIASLPASQRPQATAVYDQMLDQTSALGTELATALRAGQAAQVAALMNQLDEAKKEGHGKFNP